MSNGTFAYLRHTIHLGYGTCIAGGGSGLGSWIIRMSQGAYTSVLNSNIFGFISSVSILSSKMFASSHSLQIHPPFTDGL